MWNWLIPAAVSAVGGVVQNRSAAREARQNRQFQERMSSTAAQRSAADYRSAGFNPALAYDRPASSPGGSQAQVEDVAAKSVSSALAAQQMRANVELTRAQTAKVNEEKELLSIDRGIKSTTEGDEPSYRQEMIAKRIAALRDLAHQGRLQPDDERLRQLAVALQRESLKRGQFFGGMFGDAQGVANFVREGLSSGGGAARAFKAWMDYAGNRMRRQPKPVRSNNPNRAVRPDATAVRPRK